MPEIKQFKLPDVGEGLTEADILAWRVAVGDTVVVNQAIVEVETAKAAVELPSPFAGVVTALHVAAGDTVAVGTPIISIDTASGASAPARAAADPIPVPQEPGIQTGGRQPVLVGYGPRTDAPVRRRRRGGPSAPPGHAPAAPAPSVQPAFEVPPSRPVLAKPPVRKLAKSLGVDLTTVSPTGPNGDVTRADISSAAERGELVVPEPVRPPASGGQTRIPIRGVRKHTAAAMVASAFSAPHVTEFVTADVTATMQLRDRVAARPEFAGVKVSPLLLLARAVLLAVRRTPEINSTWDEAAGEIVLKHYVNLGIAAATERGLIVPNIKGADGLSLLELARALDALVDTARAGRTTPQDMARGTITITNVGVFGVDTGTPILNPGEAAIIAFGAVRRMPWVIGTGAEERIEPRWVTQLAVSFDHRLVDGQQGSRFLADVAAILTDPGLALL